MPIEHINKTDTLNEGREKLNNAITAFNETVVEGDSSVEAAQARVDEKGVPHPTLKARIDDGMNSVNQQLADKANQRDLMQLDDDKADKTFVQNELSTKRDKSEGIGLSDAKPDLLSAIEGGEGTEFNLLSIPKRESVYPKSTNFVNTSSNLHNKNTDISGYIIANNGNETENEAYNHTQYIPVQPFDDLYLYGYVHIAFFDENKEFKIRENANEDGETKQVPSGAYYVILNYQPHRNYPERRVNLGNKLLPYEDYYIKLEDFKPDEIGDTGMFYTGSNVDDPNINTVTKEIELKAPFYISHARNRWDFVEDISVSYTSTVFTVLLFNTKNKTFRTIESGEFDKIKKSEILIMKLNFESSSQKKLKNVWFTNNFSVNGLENESGTKIDNVFFAPENIAGHYKPSESFSYNDFDYNTSIAQDVYDKFNQLAHQNSEYIIPKNLGLDESGTYPVYRYHLKPQQVVTEGLKKELPKILIACGIHGSEKASIFSLYYLIKDICENWHTDPLLEYLRFNCEIIFIPIANPYGFNDTGRVNSNGVDINRNFPIGWRMGLPTNNTYGGTEPFSEVESKYIRDMILEFPEAVYYCDYHTNNGSGSEYYDLMWSFLIEGDDADVNIDISAKYNIEKMTREFISRYNQPNDEGFFGYISYAEEKGFSMLYAADKGIPSSTFECFRKFPNDVEYYNENVIKACTEYVGNWLLTLLKQFKQAR